MHTHIYNASFLTVAAASVATAALAAGGLAKSGSRPAVSDRALPGSSRAAGEPSRSQGCGAPRSRAPRRITARERA